jgi:hypothetical protein
VSMGLVGSAGSPRTLRVLHCTEVSQSMSQMGHSRPSRLPRNAPYDGSCLKADIR